MTKNIFVYGSLLNERILKVLLGREPQWSSARLKGYHRFSVRNQVYPAISLEPSGIVEGKVLLDIQDKEMIVLDQYEVSYV